MVRIQLHLTEHQDRRLRALAKKKRVSRADLIRQGVELLLSREAEDDPLLGLIGDLRVPLPPDASERHDAYIYDDGATALPMAAEPPGDHREK